MTRPDLTSTYTWTPVGETEPVTITPRVVSRTSPGGTLLVTISRIAPLLADRIDAIPDEGDRLHTLTRLTSAWITFADRDRPGFSPSISRDGGRILTTYTGTAALPVSAVLDMAEEIRAGHPEWFR